VLLAKETCGADELLLARVIEIDGCVKITIGKVVPNQLSLLVSVAK